MCPKEVTDIRMPRRDNENGIMGPPIIELEFEKDILDPYIIIGENIELRMKKERLTLSERCLQFGQPRKYCRSDRKLCTNFTEHLQEGRMHNCRGKFAYTAKNHTRQETKKNM